MMLPCVDDVSGDMLPRMFGRRNLFELFMRWLKNRRFVEAKMHWRHRPKVKLSRNERALDALAFQKRKNKKTLGF